MTHLNYYINIDPFGAAVKEGTTRLGGQATNAPTFQTVLPLFLLVQIRDLLCLLESISIPQIELLAYLIYVSTPLFALRHLTTYCN